MNENKHNDKTDMDSATRFTQKKYRLDTAGRFFSFVSSSKIPCVYRFFATLKNNVEVNFLQKALENIITRFPYYQVFLAKGYAWYNWTTTKKIPHIDKEIKFPCQYIQIRNGNVFPYKIITQNNQIILEMNHSLTDGMGALTFLRALICEYFILKGFTINEWGDVYHKNQDIQPEEINYSHRSYFKLGIPKISDVSKAFHLPFERDEKGRFHVISSKLPVQEILKKSREVKVTLTEYLAAVYIDVLQEIMLDLPNRIQKKAKKPIRMLVPINVRNLLPSRTMWNFTAFVAPSIDPRLGEFSFDEIIEQIHYYKNMQMNKKFIIQQISNFVAIERNPMLDITPRFIKQMFINSLYKNIGEGIFSAIMTNLGITNLPQSILNEVTSIQIIPMNQYFFKTGCALLSYNDNLYINFGRNYKETMVEDKFFMKLKDLGIKADVSIYGDK